MSGYYASLNKGDEEAMREAFVFALGAEIGAPLKAGDGVDLGRQRLEGGLHGLNLIWGGAVFELEQDNVAINARFFGSGWGRHEGENGAGREGRQGEKTSKSHGHKSSCERLVKQAAYRPPLPFVMEGSQFLGIRAG